MKRNKKRPQQTTTPEQVKDNYFEAQKETVYVAFNQPKTMLQVSVETGILRANICRYVRQLEDENKISLAYKGICPISKHKAGFYCYD
jgi:hypothetical protein